MAAFSYQQHHPYLLDQPVFFPTTTAAAATSAAAATPATTCFPENHHAHDISFHNINMDQVSFSKKLQSPGSSMSMVVDDPKVDCDNVLWAKKRKDKNVTSLNSAQSKDTTKEMSRRLKKQKKSNDFQEDQKKKKNIKKGLEEEEGHIGYIHVRARRGQATDSHSLAERVRREKISERMKLLQAIVPGCDKVTGKALMLDEIINYVQSLQNQVEFLSMKLASANPMFYDFGVDLDAFMLRPDQNMSGMGVLPIMPSVQTLSTANDNYPQLQQLIDTSTASLLFQQGQMPNILSQGNGQLLWDVDDHKQKIDSSFALNNNLTSFH